MPPPIVQPNAPAKGIRAAQPHRARGCHRGDRRTRHRATDEISPPGTRRRTSRITANARTEGDPHDQPIEERFPPPGLAEHGGCARWSVPGDDRCC